MASEAEQAELTCSSFMGGGGSECLIASVFEAGPPVDYARTTPTKASLAATKSDRDIGASDSDEDLAGGAAAAFASSKSRKNAKRNQRRARETKAKQDARVDKVGRIGVSGKSGGDDDDNEADELDKLKEEVKMVRESQLRTEEMLAKLLSGPK